eukprot:TRINITY_DN747_c0_g1_i1.p1 TRINITY_DN747_c0_g1~~TRINITY_DN747_c0_g1_i1.p1  ORF type:complete len:559 (-),score=226.13 TRINITY_DN747_c0_g1_i1:57-1733(-)
MQRFISADLTRGSRTPKVVIRNNELKMKQDRLWLQRNNGESDLNGLSDILNQPISLLKVQHSPTRCLEISGKVSVAQNKPINTRLRMFNRLLHQDDLMTPMARRIELENVRKTAIKQLFQVQRRGFASSSDLPPHTELGLPALSPTMDKGNLVKWRKKEGEKIAAGDVIAEIETDKATADFETTDDGYLAKILVPENTQDVPVGTPIAIVVDDEKDVAAFKNYSKDSTPAPAPKAESAPKKEEKKEEKATSKPTEAEKESKQPAQAPKKAPVQQPSSGKVVPGAPPPPAPRKGAASPAARAEAAERGAKASPASSQSSDSAAPSQSSGAYTDIPNSQIRKVIAKRLTESKSTIPHYYLSIECNVDKLLESRTKFNEKSDGKYKLSVNDFIVKASAQALRRVPEVNSSWTDAAIRRYHNVDINVAVNTDKGLLTPLLPNADRLGLSGINNLVKTLAEKGKEGKLSPAEQASGTFTISNLGMFGIKQFCAVINPPQACILAVGGTEKRVVAVEGSTDKFQTSNFMTVTLSCDHRVVDGAVGARWLQAFRELIEDPSRMLL